MVPVMWRMCPSARNLPEYSNGVQMVGKVHLDQGNRKCNVRAWPSMCNLPKSSKDFSSQTVHCIGLKSSLHNSPGESLYAGIKSVAIRRFVHEMSWRTDTHICWTKYFASLIFIIGSGGQKNFYNKNFPGCGIYGLAVYAHNGVSGNDWCVSQAVAFQPDL